MKREIIAVDLDEVLSAQNEAVRLFANRYYGHKHSPEDYLIEGPYWSYWENIWGVDEEEGERRVAQYIESGGLKRQKPVPGAVGAIKKLKNNYQLVIVTSRKDKHAEATHYWLNKHFPDVFNHVRFTSLWGQEASEAKAKISKEIGASYLIDDNFEHCALASKAGVKTLLFGEYGWSRRKQLPKGVIRVKNWQEVLEYFNDKGR